MADLRERMVRTGATTTTEVVDQGLRGYMLRVYNYMAVGLGLTGIAAVATYVAAVQSPALSALLYESAFRWVVIFAPLAVVMFLSFRVQHMSVAAAQLAFWVYAALVGVSFSSLGLVFAGESIARVFFITAASFGGLSLIGYTTKRDLTGMGAFLMMGVIGLFVAMIVNLFLQSSGLQFVVSVLGVLIFAGLTAYDTQKIKEMYFESDDGETMGRKAIMGALNLYLDFINMFLFMLRLFGNRN
ncbi:MAG TPA: Bax inhibitor-1/YccA family protein [Aestuariivirgaceae bacterium]|nr:Bax inhibitor-1/YccA family protein [Aestuariivirgaceae bacterium]